MTLVVHFNLKLYQKDIKLAFFNGSLSEDVYIVQPNDFVEPSKENIVVGLKGPFMDLNRHPDNST